MSKTKVSFRTDLSNGETVAVFEERNPRTGMLTCFTTAFGHSECAQNWVVNITRDATRTEAEPLVQALTGLQYGYDLEEVEGLSLFL